MLVIAVEVPGRVNKRDVMGVGVASIKQEVNPKKKEKKKLELGKTTYAIFGLCLRCSSKTTHYYEVSSDPVQRLIILLNKLFSLDRLHASSKHAFP